MRGLRYGAVAFIVTLVALMGLGPAIAGDSLGGSFKGASNHVTTGHVTISQSSGNWIVTLEDDFTFDGAPDPKLGFGNSGKFDKGTIFHKLDSLTGKQVYQVPGNIDPKQFNEFYVWCEKYSVPLGVAAIH